MAIAVTPFLMFDGDAENAMRFYVTLFEDSEITQLERYGRDEAGQEGAIKRADFRLGGQRLLCMDSPVEHDFRFTPSMSIFIECESEAEMDEVWQQLSVGGQVLMPLDDYGLSKRFGWLNDRFGVSWQLNLAQ